MRELTKKVQNSNSSIEINQSGRNGIEVAPCMVLLQEVKLLANRVKEELTKVGKLSLYYGTNPESYFNALLAYISFAGSISMVASIVIF